MLASRAASAQSQPVPQADTPQWLKDRRYNEGIGLRAGDLELHPGIAGEFGYDSNWLLRSDRAGVVNGPAPPPGFQPAPIVPALEFRVTPSFYVSTLASRREGDVNAPPPSFLFRAGANLTYRAFICLGSNCSGQNDISQQSSFAATSIGANARLDIQPERPVGGAVYVNYARAAQPNLTTIDPNLSFNNDALTGGAELALQPGSGTLDWHFGYQVTGILFEDSAGVGFNNLTHTALMRGRWKFRPRTALVYDGSLGFASYTNPPAANLQGLVNSSPVHTRIGLNGLVTDRFGLLALVGWGASFTDTTLVPQQPQYDSVIGQAEARFFLSANPGASALSELGLALSSMTLGYSRDFQSSYLGNFYGTDRGYVRFNYFFAGRALVTLEGGVGAVEYPTMYWLPAPPTHPGPELRHAAFTDIRADATLFGEYRFSNTFGLNATLRYSENFSQTHDIRDIQDNPLSQFDMAWTRFEAFLGARWFM